MKILESFVDNIKQKTTNPFFGTLILVWFFRNWELIYTLFNFDSDCTLNDKKQFIRNYINTQNHWYELFLNISISLILMILGYFLIVITRVFVNWIDHKIVPELNLKFVSKLVVSNSRFEESEKQRIDNYNALLIERENLNKLEVKINELKGTISKLDIDLANANSAVTNLSKENADTKQRYTEAFDSKTQFEKIVELNKEKIKNLKIRISLLETFTDAGEKLYLHYKISPYLFNKYIELKEKDSATFFFKYLVENINKKDNPETEINPEFVELFVNANLISFKEKLEENELYKLKNLAITEHGHDFIKHETRLEESYKIALQKKIPKDIIE